MVMPLFEDALNIYEYGSIVYGTYVEGKSDRDYVVIVPDDYAIDTDQIEYDNCHYNIFHAKTWQEKLNNNEIDAMEVFFLPQKHVIKETKKFTSTIEPVKIREQFSRTASNSFVKCKKKLIVKDSYAPRIAKKSLWHALRIINFGIQILTNGKITDYGSVNYLYDEIVNNDVNDWSYYQANYRSLYNQFKSKFRIAEKENPAI